MRYIGLDIATTTGWASFEDEKLLERGSIQLIQGMDLPQKLHYFHLELKRVLERANPDWCFVEDVFLGISGAKTLAYLARLNGVAINASFEVLQQNVKLYEPNYWKANSFKGLSGQAKKWQIQLAAVRHFNLPITGNFEDIDRDIREQDQRIKIYKIKVDIERESLNKMKVSLVRKRNPLSDEEKKNIKMNIKISEEEIKSLKFALKRCETSFDKMMSKTSLDISAQTGMTDNICDACGIALCGYKEINENN